jgi:hypothetical protein
MILWGTLFNFNLTKFNSIIELKKEMEKQIGEKGIENSLMKMVSDFYLFII